MPDGFPIPRGAFIAYDRDRLLKTKTRALARSQAPSVQLKSSDTSGITSFSTSASIEARTIFIMRNPEMSTNTGEPICQTPNIRGTACTVRYNPAGLRLACWPNRPNHETPIRGNGARLPVHYCGASRPDLSPFGKAARTLDRPGVDCSHHRCRRRSLLAQGAELGSVAAACLARLSRCGERISFAVGICTTYSAADNFWLCLAGAAYFQIFPIRAISVKENYCSRSRVAGSACRTRLTGPATESDPVSTVVNATAASTKGSCAEAW